MRALEEQFPEVGSKVRGAIGRFNYFLTGDYLQNRIGISPATPNGAIHDDTRQGHGFGYFEYLLDATSKVSAIAGSFVGNFQIPITDASGAVVQAASQTAIAQSVLPNALRSAGVSLGLVAGA